MNNKELLEKLKENIAIQNFKDEIILEKNKNNTLERKIGGIHMKKKLVSIVCGCFIIISGVVFATNYEKIVKNFRGLGDGVDRAAESGYVVEPESSISQSNTVSSNSKTGMVIKDINTKVEITDFIMDDLNISTGIDFNIDTKINESININEIKSIFLEDLIVTDENENVLFCMDRERLKKYCKENNLNIDEFENSEKYYNCGLNNFIQAKSSEIGLISLQYNMYSGSESFPRSHKLKFEFTKIALEGNLVENNKIVENINKAVLEGNWKIEVNVPEKMYNRTSINYKKVETDNKDFEVYAAKVSDTGFEIGVTISNIKKPEDLSSDFMEKIFTLNEDFESGKISKEEAEKIKDEYYDWLDSREPISITESFREEKRDKEKVSYIKNAKGEKFYCTLSPSRKAHTNFTENDKFDFYETFGLTKYDATDEITAVLYYYGNPVTIKLEKQNN